MQIIGIGGVPATGKSLLMRSVLTEIDEHGSESLEFGLVKGSLYPEEKVIVLGKYSLHDVNPGTDRLSMAVQRDTEKLVEHLATDRQWNFHTMIFEGDRLFNGSFMDFCNGFAWTVCHWLLLTIPEKEQRVRLRNRYRRMSISPSVYRGVDRTWLKGRATKADNLSQRGDICISQHEKSSQTMALTREIVQRIRKFATG